MSPQNESIAKLLTMIDKVKPLIDKCKTLGLDDCAYALETFSIEMPKAIERDRRRLTRDDQQQSLMTQTEKQVIDKQSRLF